MPNAARSGTFKIGGDLKVNRLGFGAMRITGTGVWGPPQDKNQALGVLKDLAGLGVDFIDTADSYGPEVSENLIREALHPYKGFVIATKGGLTRPGPGSWLPNGNPDYLIKAAHQSRERLGVERIDLWQLHRIDPNVPADEQFAAIKSLQGSGVIRHVGLSEVLVADIQAAQKFFPVTSVQNRYNLADRKSEAVLDFCEQHAIGFIPWFPLAAGDLAKPGGTLDKIAAAHKVQPGAVALAWLLKRSPVMLPIPGTSSRAHLKENIEGAEIALSDAEFKALSG